MSTSTPPPLLRHKPQHLQLALLLGAASAVATLALFPYLAVLMPQKLAALPLPLWAAALLQAGQAGILCWLLAWLGLFLGARHGLDAPWLRAWLERRAAPASGHWWQAAALGVLAALLVIGLSLLGPHPPQPATTISAASWAWRGALASLYGAIAEEVQTRLFLVSLLVWLMGLLRRGRAAPDWMYLGAIVLAALLFGAGHLPAAINSGLAGTPLLMVRIVGLNALAGVVFGWLFWRRGLEHAMLAHFCADLVLHVAAPLAGMS